MEESEAQLEQLKACWHQDADCKNTQRGFVR